MTPTSKQLPRYCLITVGATVGFNDLIKEAIHPDFWHDLNSRGFTALRIQCGPDIESATKRLATLENNKPRGMTVDVFEVSRNLMTEEMTLCKPSRGQRHQGLVISHAGQYHHTSGLYILSQHLGTGTILDAWKLSLPIIVVPNTRLLDDHQTEMAKHLAKEGYATMSTAW